MTAILAKPPRFVQTILSTMAAKWSTTTAVILSGAQHANVVGARGEAIRELRKAGFSTTQIGRYLGGLHHTTVLYHCGVQSGVKSPRVKTPYNRPPGIRWDDLPADESGIWAI